MFHILADTMMIATLQEDAGRSHSDRRPFFSRRARPTRSRVRYQANEGVRI